MKFFKLALLVLPLFVIADNPVDPADIDAVKEVSEPVAQKEVAQVEPSKADSKEMKESVYKEETPSDAVILFYIVAMMVL
jgi:hypothetical protein